MLNLPVGEFEKRLLLLVKIDPVSLMLDVTLKLYTGDSVLYALDENNTVPDFDCTGEYVYRVDPVSLRLLIEVAVLHVEAVDVFETECVVEPDPETVLVFEPVADDVNVWLAELLCDVDPLDEPLDDIDEMGLILSKVEAVTEGLPLSVYVCVLNALGE